MCVCVCVCVEKGWTGLDAFDTFAISIYIYGIRERVPVVLLHGGV